jgi:uncharacterized protein YlxP (DUF503 family)
MQVAAVRFELHIPESRSLKAKRSVVRPIVEGLRRRMSVSVSEVDHHDTWQRAAIGVAVVAPDAAHLEQLLRAIHDYVDRHEPEVVVLEVSVAYLEEPG